jgi:hypothetical protein
MDVNTRIIDLTVGDLLDLIKKEQPVQEPVQVKDYTEGYVYGLKGLAKLLGCSKQHAMRIKASGKLDKAIIQNGRTIIIDSQLALELFGKQ